MEPKLRTQFQEELHTLQQKMKEMAVHCDLMLEGALEALLTGNIAKTKEVVRADDAVDALDIEIENLCLTLIALQQPVAHDLRVIGTTLKAITDLERVGDYAVDIAKVGRRLSRASQPYVPLVDVPHLFRLTREMLQRVIECYLQENLESVFALIRFDDAIDDEYIAMREVLLSTLREDNSRSVLILNLLFVITYLERVCDHLVSIAARVHFLITGEFLRPNDVT